ncbi:MAG: HAD family hydrolase [Planctomycetaceae bacterium]|nr:HAD family hydrolase [Planctomycetaceae bacterium]
MTSRVQASVERQNMVLSLAEFADALDERNLIWPRPPAAQAVKATPYVAKLPGIRAVLWDVYGTLLRVSDGKLSLFPTEEVRLQIALDKTIHEFRMWNHMYRKPGPPWQSMIGQYTNLVERLGMVASERKGDFTDVDLTDVWQAIIEKLFEKEYQFDESEFGSLHDYSQKVAYFFHSSLQGLEARPGAVAAMTDIAAMGLFQGLLADSQPFTLVQLLRALAQQATLPPLHEFLRSETLTLSSQLGIRKPSRTLFSLAAEKLRELGVQPDEILHVSCRLETDLVPARNAGMKTALLAAEKLGLQVPAELLRDPQTRPDRLLTDLSQLRSVLGSGS